MSRTTPSQALRLRKQFGFTVQDIAEQVRRRNATPFTAQDLYNELKIKQAQHKLNKEWQTRNARNMKRRVRRPLQEVTFLNDMLDAPHPVHVRTINPDNIHKRFFLDMTFRVLEHFKGRDDGWSVPYDRTIQTIGTFECSLRHLHGEAERYAIEIGDIIDSNKTSIYIRNSLEYTINREENFLNNRNILDIPMRRGAVMKYDFMPKIADISFNTTDTKCVMQCLADRYGNLRKDMAFSQKSIEKDMKTFYDDIYREEDDTSPDWYITSKMVHMWCTKYKISCYGFDIKNKLFLKHLSESRNYPTLVFYAVDEHMYMIDDVETINSIGKKHARVVKIATGATNPDVVEPDYTNEHIYDYDVLKLLVDKLPSYTIIDMLELIISPSIVMVQSSNLYDIFVELFKKGRVPMVKHHGDSHIKVIPYLRADGTTIQIMADSTHGIRNVTYRDVMTICKQSVIPFNNQGVGTLARKSLDVFRKRQSLRLDFSFAERTMIMGKLGNKCCKCGEVHRLQIDHIRPLKNGGRHVMTNFQLLCRACHLAKTKVEAANGLFDDVDPIVSNFSQKLVKLFESIEMQKWAFVEKLGQYEAKIGYDINKCRKNIMYYTKYDWCVYSVLDDVKTFKAGQTIGPGFYYVESKEYFPLRGNGWYSQAMVEYCIDIGIIWPHNIKYFIKPSMTLKPDYFNDFIDQVYNEWGSLDKLAINALIGCFYRKDFMFTSSFYTRSFDEASYLFTEYAGSTAIYKKDIDGYVVQFDELRKLNQTESPIYLQVLDEEAIEVHKLSKIVGNVSWVKTDCVYSDKKVDISKYEWAAGIPKYKYEKVNVTNIQMKPKSESLRSRRIKFDTNKWNIVEDSDDFKVLANEVLVMESCNINGRAGTGKSTLIRNIKEMFDAESIKYVCLAPTNKAARNIDGMTIDKYVGKGKRLMKMQRLISRLDAIIVDEISMMHEKKYKDFLTMKRMKPSLRFVLVGDYDQLLPVKDRADFDYENSQALFELCGGNKIALTKCRRADDALFELCKDVSKVVKGDFGKAFTWRNICFTNAKRQGINAELMNKSVIGKDFVVVKKYALDVDSQDMKLCVGTPLIARRNCREYDICNNDTFNVTTLGRDEIGIMGPEREVFVPKKQFAELFHVAYCITTHRAQGETIKEPYTIHEWGKMDARLKYVALSRATDIKNINIL